MVTASAPLKTGMLAIKRLFDICAAACGLIVFSPILLATAIAVHFKLGSPVLFRQQRAGKDEKTFMLCKFRSMRNAYDANGKPLADAERLSAFGHWLRASSLDELPELWNVLRGDMSVVGPRPLLPDYLPYYSEEQKLRHRMRPGLTGLAQVNGRNLLGWDERLALDSWYATHWSLWLDLKIILSTFWIVLARRGIHAPGEATMSRFDDHVRARQGRS